MTIIYNRDECLHLDAPVAARKLAWLLEEDQLLNLAQRAF